MTRDLFDIMNDDNARGDDDAVQTAKHHDFEMVLHLDRPKSIYASLTGYERDAKWLGKQAVRINPSNRTSQAVRKDGQRVVLPVIMVAVPEWLAREEGLI